MLTVLHIYRRKSVPISSLNAIRRTDPIIFITVMSYAESQSSPAVDGLRTQEVQKDAFFLTKKQCEGVDLSYVVFTKRNEKPCSMKPSERENERRRSTAHVAPSPHKQNSMREKARAD
mmetsp:Transcript_25011/g.59413  ORF Transcript_25011/g.59413 Transcript_25011/m.59413 type:complete len:118 (+) Transcript_25011:266-619(+)